MDNKESMSNKKHQMVRVVLNALLLSVLSPSLAFGGLRNRFCRSDSVLPEERPTEEGITIRRGVNHDRCRGQGFFVSHKYRGI